jgi:hypothetical protein
MNLSKFVQTQTGKYLMSILIGFGLASLFREVCKGKRCIIFNAPPLETLNDKVYKHDNKCYKYEAVSAKCDPKKKIIHF